MKVPSVQDNAVLWWLQGEDAYQFDKNATTLNADPAKSIEAIWGNEIASKLDRYDIFRKSSDGNELIALQALQAVLKSCAAARGAYVWCMVGGGLLIKDAREQSWQPVTAALEDADVVNDPTEVRRLLLKPPELQTIARVTGCLAVASSQFIEDQDLRVIPNPGVSSGDITPITLDEIPLAT